MNTHIVLSDIKLNRTLNSALDKIPERNVNCRLAYLSGSYLALIVVLSWEVVDRPFLTEDFWFVLDDFDNLTAHDVVCFISARSLEKINITEEMVPNPGLLKGVTQKYYVKGYRDCAEVVVGRVRELFASRYDEGYSHHFQEYLGEKLTEVANYMDS